MGKNRQITHMEKFQTIHVATAPSDMGYAQRFSSRPLEWTGWISLKSKGLSRVFSNTQFKSINFLCIASCYYDFSTNFSINLQAVHQWCALMDFKGGLKERV